MDIVVGARVHKRRAKAQMVSDYANTQKNRYCFNENMSQPQPLDLTLAVVLLTKMPTL